MIRDVSVIIFTVLGLLTDLRGAVGCVVDTECGWNRYCQSAVCQCLPGYRQHGTACLDTLCDEPGCLECRTSSVCRRCVNYIEEGSGKCLDECEANYELIVEGVQVGRVCKAKQLYGISIVYLIVIIAISVGVIVIVIVTVAVYWRIHTRRERQLRKKIMEQTIRKEQQCHGKLSSINFNMSHSSGKLNHAFESQTLTERSLSSFDSLPGDQQVALLSAHRHTLLEMLQKANRRQHRPDASDPRIASYRILARNLEGVLALLDSGKPPTTTDGRRLLTWAERNLRRYRASREGDHDFGRCTHSASSTAPRTSLSDHGPQRSTGNTSTFVSHGETSTRSTYMESDRELCEIAFDRSEYSEPIEV